MLNLVRQLFGGKRTPPKRLESITTSTRPGGLRPRTGSAPSKPTAELLNNPSLKLESGKNDGFDPYNTGTFNRSGSWERVNKRRKG
jgi:hypothetical protein